VRNARFQRKKSYASCWRAESRRCTERRRAREAADSGIQALPEHAGIRFGRMHAVELPIVSPCRSEARIRMVVVGAGPREERCVP